MNGLELRNLRKKHGVNQEEIAKHFHLTRKTISLYEKSEVPKDRIQAFKEYFEGIESKNVTLSNITSNNEVKHILKETPFYDVDFYSGFKSIFNDQTIQPSFFFYHPDFLKAEFAVKNSGKSMGEVLSGNDIIGLRQIHNWKDYFPQGEIYAVVTSNDLRTVKYVRRDPANEKLVLIPRPKEEDKFLFPEFEEVSIEMVIAIFQVVASLDSRKLAM